MRGAALVVAAVGLCLGALPPAAPGVAPGVTPCSTCGPASKSNVARLDRAWEAVRRSHRCRPGSSNCHRGAASARGGSSRVADDETTYVTWLRYTHPRKSYQAGPADEKVLQGSFPQKVDHLDAESNATWTQAYYSVVASVAAADGPVFVMLSGSADYDTDSDWLLVGQMAELARTHQADRYFLPTRFFDPAHPPTADTSPDNLNLLSVEQILQDVGGFLDHLKSSGRLSASRKVILFGAGFGGALATWARLQYPTEVHGVVASSATLQTTYNTYTYFPVVTQAVRWYQRADDCNDALRAAMTKLETSLGTEAGRTEFNRAMQPCTPLPVADAVAENDRAHIMGLVASIFADLVQEDEDGPDDYGRPGGDKLAPYCYILTLSSGDPLSILGEIVSGSKEGRCLDTTFQGLAASVASANWTHEANKGGLRQWLWLQCTELGQLPTTTSSSSTFPFSKRINMTFYKDLCEAVFGAGVMDNLVTNIRTLTNLFGGKNPPVSNAVFAKGNLDPWRDLSPDDDFSGSEVLVVDVLRASHAHDMFPRDETGFDPPWMPRARHSIAKAVRRWLQQPAPRY